MLDSLVRVSRRAVGNHFVSITLTLSHLQESLIITQNIACNKSHHYKWQANLIGCQATSIDSTTSNRAITMPKQIPSPKPSLAKPIHADLPKYRYQSNTSFIHFPFNNFRYFLTLFSKFFSSFLHSTCSLSVSRLYLALDGIYHPLGLQSQAIRLVGCAPYAN